MVRALAICAVLAGCGRPEAPAAPRHPAGAATAAPAGAAATGGAAAVPASPPGPRLVDGVTPTAYDVRLELDPDRPAFTGRVAIEIAIAVPTQRLWLHAVDLEISGAHLRTAAGDEPVGLLVGDDGSGMRGFALRHPIERGTVTLVIDYRGRVIEAGHRGKDEEGLFRERAGGRWYLYSQAESIFARRIVPCFDEPRFKSAWRVTAVVPAAQVALGNAPVAAERALPDGRREVRFAEIAALPSYLLAVAVGPFELVDAGRLGRGRIPVRLAVAAGDRKRVGHALRDLPRVIDVLEDYVGAALPLAKLDLVAVPEFFGAMENPGLITFQAGVLVGGRDFVAIAAHELAHQWFGNSVTPAWWDDLWLSEAFSSWMAAHVMADLGPRRIPALAHRGRVHALAADDRIDAVALIHPVPTSADVEPAFDAIAYDKGAAVLAMFERMVGAPVFRAAVRSYLTAHAGTSVTSQAFLDALAAATTPAIADALSSNLHFAGTPRVWFGLQCPSNASSNTPGASPGPAELQIGVSTSAGRVTVPVCFRYPAPVPETGHQCVLVDNRPTTLTLPAAVGCPSWVVGNDGGQGYYATLPNAATRPVPMSELSPDELLARGDDFALAVRRDHFSTRWALVEIATLAGAHDPHATLAALEIARAMDTLVDDAVRPAWTAWLATQLADRMTETALLEPRSVAEYFARGAILDLMAGEIAADIVAVARARVDRLGDRAIDPVRLAIAATRDGGALFDRLVRVAAAARGDDRAAAIELLGAFPGAYASRVVELLLDARFTTDQVWPALAAMLGRGESRSAAWHALHPRFAQVIAALAVPAARTGAVRDALGDLAALCTPEARAELADDAGRQLPPVPGSERMIARMFDAIDSCVSRRRWLSNLPAALATVPPASRRVL